MSRPDVSLVTSGHDVADARLHREAAALLRAGLRVEVLGLGDASAGPVGADVRAVTRKGLASRLVRAALLPWRARGRVLVCLDPDLVPSARLRRLAGRPVVVDVHEDYVALLRDRSWAVGLVGRLALVVARLSSHLAAGADLTVLADEHLPPATARERLVVRNLPDVAHLPVPRDPDPVPRAVYVGDLRSSRGLFAMLETITAAPGWELDLVGPVAASDQARLETWLAASPAAARVRCHGRLPPAAAWELAAGAWVGLALLEPTPAFLSAVPSKLHEYLAVGLVPLVTELPRMVDLVERSGAGLVVADATEAAGALRALGADRDRFDRLRTAALRWRDEPARYDELARRVAELAGQTARRRRT